jgi:hypothetical protein
MICHCCIGKLVELMTSIGTGIGSGIAGDRGKMHLSTVQAQCVKEALTIIVQGT